MSQRRAFATESLRAADFAIADDPADGYQRMNPGSDPAMPRSAKSAGVNGRQRGELPEPSPRGPELRFGAMSDLRSIMGVEIGSPAPDFSLRDQHRNHVSLADLQGNKTLIVFMPWAFSGTCTGEVCQLRDNLSGLNQLDTNVVVITTDSFFTNAAWAAQEDLEYPVLADHWPHGAVAQAFGTFNDKLGVATRSTYVLDEDGLVRDIITTDELGTARDFDAYTAALSAIPSRPQSPAT